MLRVPHLSALVNFDTSLHSELRVRHSELVYACKACMDTLYTHFTPCAGRAGLQHRGGVSASVSHTAAVGE